MKQIRIKDNQYRFKEEFVEVDKVTSRVADKTLEQLQKDGIFVFPEMIKESDDLTKDQMILQSINNMYVSGNVMGFFGVENQRIVIESRFSKGSNDFFFQYLLERVLEFPNLINLETNARQEDAIFNLLVCLFPRYLKLAIRKGIFKTYIHKQYNDGTVKGTIDIARHIKRNTPFIGNIAYSQREYAYDNYLIELIRHTIEYIKGKSCGRIILNTINDEVKQIVQATPAYKAGDRRKIIEENRKNVVRHAYYHEYRSLQQLCILILRNEKHQYGNGSANVYGILFDGAWLWEEYLNLLIGDQFYHPMNKVGEGAQRLFEGNNGVIYPDFIGKDIEKRVVADAKYKPINNISGRDYLQVLAYMYRFDAKQGFYLYPEAENAENQTLRMNRGTTYENNVRPREDISIGKVGLRIPSESENYSRFIEQMRINEGIFKEYFRE